MTERTVLSPPYPRQMEDHFNRLSDELQLARGFAADRTTWQKRRRLVRRKLVRAVGGFPERTPLNAQVTGRLERDGYAIEKLVYESRPGFQVTGALYLPELPHPAPAVFCPHGHWPDGRYNEHVQSRMVGFAKRGYIVLSVDKVGYNDRLSQGHQTREAFLTGLTTQGLQLWDNMRGIDYLLARPEADAQRLGCTGCSGGGNQTMYLSALDERIKVSAPVCSVELGECYLHKQFCTCELVPGLRRFADLVDICGLIAPRALLLVHGLLDPGFRIDSARKAKARIQQIYDVLGAPDRLDHFVSYSSHAYNQEMREAVYGWFDRHLKGLEPPYAPEGEVTVEEAPALSSFPNGLPEGHVTVHSLYLEQCAKSTPPAVPATIAEQRLQAESLRAELGELFAGWPGVTPLRAHPVAADTETIGGVGAVVESLYFHSEPDVVIPAVLYKPALIHGPPEAVIRCGHDGRRDVPEAAIAADLSAGRATLCIDPRGTGETRVDAPTSLPQQYLSSVTLGRHFAAMRAWDIRRAADYLLSRDDISTVALGLHGGLLNGLVGLLAAATDPRLARVEVETLLSSFKGRASFGALAEQGQQAIIPGLLNVADIDDLLGLVAPRPVEVRQFVDGLGQPIVVDASELRATAVYGLLGAADQLVLP